MLDKPALAFIDLWGNSHNALHDPPRYITNLDHFRNSIQRHSSAFLKNPKDQAFVLHDCAYVGCEKLRTLAQYLRAVRDELVKKKLYLQGAIHCAALQHDSICYPSKRQPRVQGYVFGEAAPRAYSRHHALKSIAVRLDYRDELRDALSEEFVASCHSPAQSGTHVEPLLDLRFSPPSLDANTVRDVVRDCLSIRSRSRTTWRYFLPLLVTLIRSIDWSTASDGDPDKDAGRQYLESLLRGAFQAHLSYLHGAELVYFSLLDELESRDLGGLFDEVLRFVVDRGRFYGSLDTVPDEILRPQAREAIVDGRLKLTKRERARRREDGHESP
jgi:hypothetical protein